MKIAFAVALVLLTGTRAVAGSQVPTAEPAQLTDLSSILEPIRAKHDIPALAGAIVSRGELEAIGVCGVRERGGEVAVTIDDRFHLGSCTKAMTATLCAILVEKGQLTWEGSVADSFGSAVAKQSPAWKDVQLQHLLTNRSGAPGNLDADGLWASLWASKEKPAGQRLLLARGVLGREPEAAAGARYIYSNAGFSLAGAMAERAAKLDFEALMQRELFAPLGMDSAGFGPPGDGKKLSQPLGHTSKGVAVPWGVRADNPAAIAPAGRVHCTIGDWAKFIALHVDAENGRPRLLSPESFARLHAPAAGEGQAYAMGWVVTERSWAGGTVLTHSGSNTMWYAVAWLAPKKDFAVLVCANQGGDVAQKACDDAASALIQAHGRQR